MAEGVPLVASRTGGARWSAFEVLGVAAVRAAACALGPADTAPRAERTRGTAVGESGWQDGCVMLCLCWRGGDFFWFRVMFPPPTSPPPPLKLTAAVQPLPPPWERAAVARALLLSLRLLCR